MILGLHHISITTPDLDRLTAFYHDLFGFELKDKADSAGGGADLDRITGLTDAKIKINMLRMENTLLELVGFEHPQVKAGNVNRLVSEQGITHFCMAVSDIQDEYARLMAAGVRFQCPPLKFDGVGWATHGRDPDGNIFELVESEPSAQRAGTDHGD